MEFQSTKSSATSTTAASAYWKHRFVQPLVTPRNHRHRNVRGERILMPNTPRCDIKHISICMYIHVSLSSSHITQIDKLACGLTDLLSSSPPDESNEQKKTQPQRTTTTRRWQTTLYFTIFHEVCACPDDGAGPPKNLRAFVCMTYHPQHHVTHLVVRIVVVVVDLYISTRTSQRILYMLMILEWVAFSCLCSSRRLAHSLPPLVRRSSHPITGTFTGPLMTLFRQKFCIRSSLRLHASDKNRIAVLPRVSQHITMRLSESGLEWCATHQHARARVRRWSIQASRASAIRTSLTHRSVSESRRTDQNRDCSASSFTQWCRARAAQDTSDMHTCVVCTH